MFRLALGFLKELLEKRSIIVELTKNDFRSSYLGSYLGIFWAFLHPALFIGILWFVFQIGFRQGGMGDFPFILWLTTGIVPWFFFAGCLQDATQAILNNDYLVKKMLFSVGMLPIVKILSNLIVHVVFLFVVLLLFAAYGYMPDLYSLQLLYYLFALCVFLLGLSWLTSSVVIFVKDLKQAVGILIQFGFWLTPIFWSPTTISGKYLSVIKLNPVYYVISGYRDTLINKSWFWEHPLWTLYFWVVTGFFFVGGAVIFRKLRPHFADVL
jgi:lipopolysaccharide transport system permease protein/teichoic acid transport system permease protein